MSKDRDENGVLLPGHSVGIDTRFKPGQSGNPGGYAKGVRNRINASFLNALAKDFDTNGAKAIEACRDQDPAAYVRVLAALLPKEVEVKRPLEEITDDELRDAVRALQSFLDATAVEAGASGAGQSSQAH